MMHPGFLKFTLGLILLSAYNLVEAGPPGRHDGNNIIWQIGKHDGLSTGFAGGQRDSINYIIGQSISSKDFPALQLGDLCTDNGTIQPRAHPYSILFSKPADDDSSYMLVLYLYYFQASPSAIDILINGRKGIFPVSYEIKKDENDDQGNQPLLSKQKIEILIESSWLKESHNKVTIIPKGSGSMYYDAVIFEKRAPSPKINRKPYLKPTIFYYQKAGKLTEETDLQVPFTKSFTNGSAAIHIAGKKIAVPLKDDNYDFGILTKQIELPTFSEPQEAIIRVNLDGTMIQDSQLFIPAKKWRFYITPRVHNDVGYTTVQPDVNELDTRNFDRVLKLLGQYPGYQYDFEDTHLIENDLNSRTKPWREKFYQYAKQGRVGNSVLYLNLLTGLCSGEELFRATYEAYKLHLLHGTSFDFASLTDVPSSSWFLPTMLNDVGVHYFTEGSNQSRGSILQHSDLNRNSPFYWEGMNGAKVMMWYARAYFQLSQLIYPGGFSDRPVPNYNVLDITLPQFLTRYCRKDYAPDAVMVYGAYVENVIIPQDGDMPLINKWNKNHAYPKLIMATDDDFFNYIAKHFKNELPTYRGGGGAYWEDGAASTAKATELNRHTKQLLPVAQTAASVSSILSPRYKYKTEQFSSIWKNILLYDEHTWGSYRSTSQPDRNAVKEQWQIKQNYAQQANIQTKVMLTRSFSRLSHLCWVKGDVVFAFNFQPWQRTNPVEIELNDGQYLFDLTTDKPVRYEVLSQKEGFHKILFLANNIPAMGYKEYAIRSLHKAPKGICDTENVSGIVAESPWYQLTIDEKTGGIKRLVDRETGEQLVDPHSKYTLNEYLYVSGGEGTRIWRGDNKDVPPTTGLNVDHPTSAKIIKNISSPIGRQIVVETQAENTPAIRITYQLYNNIKRIDIKDEIIKKNILKKEAVYFAFPFMSKQPQMAYQIQNGWVDPTKDLLPGADLDWFATQNLVQVKDSNYTMVLSTPDAPLITLTDINRGKWYKELKMTNGHIFSYVMNNYWFTNYKASQGGKFVFNYAITSGKNLSSVQLTRFDANTRTPVLLYTDLFTHFSTGLTPEGPPLLSSTENSFMKISNHHLQFVTLKQAENGEGWILRLKAATDQTGTAKITFPLFIVQKAYLTNGVEKNEKMLPVMAHSVMVSYQPDNYITLRLYLKQGT